MADAPQPGSAGAALADRVRRMAHRARERDIERAVKRGGAALPMDFSEPRRPEPPTR